MKDFYENHIIDLALAVLFLALGILLLPPLSLGEIILDVALAVGLLIYLFTFLVRRLSSAKGTVLVLTVIEFTVILLIALGLVLKQFNVFNIADSCQIVGVVIWLRSVVSLVRGYFVSTSDGRRAYPLLTFLLFIGLVTLGTWLFAAPIFTDATLALILCVVSFVLFALFTVFTILFWPRGKKPKSKQTS